MRMKYLAAMLASTATPAALYAPMAHAQTDQRTYDIAPQRLGDALRKYSEVSGREVIHSGSLTEGKRSGRAQGRLTPDAALTRLLSGTGLIAEVVDGALVIREGNGDATAELASTDASSEAIVVTGTRIRGTGPVGSPVTIIDREALDRSGRTTLADFIQTIPQNFSGGPTEAVTGSTARGNAGTNLGFGSGINLRGLGSGSTLTLFDGARPALGGGAGAFTDLSLVPSVAIERIEILTDGASAIYGSDAIAGVVNIRFRNRFQGLETRMRVGTADGDFGEVQASQIAGVGWKSGHLVVAGEYYRRGNLASSKRAFATEDLRPFGGPDLRSNYNNPGTIVAANGRVFAIPRGQDGTALTPEQLLVSGFKRGDARRNIDIFPRQETVSLYATVEQDLSDKINLFARALFAERHFAVRRRLFGPQPLRVTSANPYYVDPIGTGQPITVYYDPSAEFGPEGTKGVARAFNTSFGGRATLGPWSVELSGGYGLQRERDEGVNVVNRLKLLRALAATDRRTAINVFGDGLVNDRELIDSLRGGQERKVRYEVMSSALRADGPLFKLPAGEVKAAIGAEYRRDRLRYQALVDVTANAPIPSPIPGLPDKRIVKSIYGELAIPVFDAGGALPGALTLSAAARYEDYSDVGDTANPKFGLRWTPVPGLSLRASYGRSFRAPYFTELVGSANALYQTLLLPDPASATGQSVVLGLFGFRPDLGPEKASSWTAGIDVEPAFAPGAKFNATWFEISYRDRIASASADVQNFLVRRDIYGGIVDETPGATDIAAYFASPSFSNPLGVTQADIAAIIDGRTLNLSRATVSGIDFDASYARALPNGGLDISVGGTRMLRFRSQITDRAPAIDVLGTLGNPVKLRLRARVGANIGAFDAGLAVNHVAAYRNLTVTPAERVKSWTTFDLQLGLRVAEQEQGRAIRLTAGITNLFDRNPPYARFVSSTSAFGYDPEQASAVGRMFSLQAVVSW
ncbi:MAG: TonB-dependent receptor [Sphingopyxis sp.]|uniref:TonB-dependent receptor n=1 Tax=Sphingopyxis sp. TaxID=1908224 RepID=UPI001A232B99|nr:TonB-dependent receptor [Sphingopyxis sp.]MBJ7501002.1 TonB-dependent receptor [Sphingopyxis sp.]